MKSIRVDCGRNDRCVSAGVRDLFREIRVPTENQIGGGASRAETGAPARIFGAAAVVHDSIVEIVDQPRSTRTDELQFRPAQQTFLQKDEIVLRELSELQPAL